MPYVSKQTDWEKVRTTKITMSKTKKNSENSVDDQNVEMVFLVDQNVEKQIITTSKSKLSQRRKANYHNVEKS
jgi:hypothetical protein